MGKHRLDPGRRSTRRTAPSRPRPGRIAAAALSLVVTLVALLGAVGVLPLQTARGGEPAAAAERFAQSAGSAEEPAEGSVRESTEEVGDEQPAQGSAEPSDELAQDLIPGSARTAAQGRSAAAQGRVSPGSTELPADSGSGRRVVFSEGGQRVWIVDAAGTVVSTYLVSGSLLDNLDPGTYEVFSRSRWARGIDDSGVMEYFVRFAHGKNAAIGFHSIPTKNGRALQTEAQLGTPQSHGCIRQKTRDAQRMWAFADIGTTVVVVA